MRNLLLRVGTGAVFLPVLFVIISRGDWLFATFVFLVVGLGAWEWWRLGRPRDGLAELVLLLVGVWGALQGGRDPRPDRLALFLALWAAIAALVLLRRDDGRAHERAGHLVLGLLYVGLMPAFLLRMRALPEGREAVLLAYGVVFACDTVAYAVGRLLGRHPLWTRISPRKTVEGALGGLVGAVGAALLGRALMPGLLGTLEAIGFGVLVGTVGQAGDLVESHWKREAGRKDSSRLLPGHGGVLDRFDNLHFVAPALYAYLTYCV